MRRFSGALGLRGHERVAGGQGSRADLRWTIPLPRRLATLVKSRVESAPTVYKDLVVPKHPTRMEVFEATYADLPSGRVGYMAGASFVCLRRLLVVDAAGVSVEAARRSAVRTLTELGLEPLAREPEHQELYRHLRAAVVLRQEPSLYVQLFDEAETWPPSLEDLAALEAELGVPPSDAAAVRVVADRATNFALIRDRMLDRLAPQLYVVSDQLDEVATWCAAGFLAPRWQLVGHGVRPTSLVGLEDLKSAAGAYSAFRVLTSRRVGTFILEPQEYLVMVSAAALDRVERHVVDRDQYGSLGALSAGLSEPSLRSALATEILSPDLEVLFPDGLPAGLILGVVCKSQEGAARLLQVLDGYRLRVRTVVADRYVAL